MKIVRHPVTNKHFFNFLNFRIYIYINIFSIYCLMCGAGLFTFTSNKKHDNYTIHIFRIPDVYGTHFLQHFLEV